MKELLINEILNGMTGELSEEQMSVLKATLYIKMHDYQVERMPTAVSEVNGSWVYWLNLFLARKGTEGKSERTIEQYRIHLKILLSYLNKNVQDITDDDLFCYLITYKKLRRVSNAYFSQ